jgi:hypothetical protein
MLGVAPGNAGKNNDSQSYLCAGGEKSITITTGEVDPDENC